MVALIVTLAPLKMIPSRVLEAPKFRARVPPAPGATVAAPPNANAPLRTVKVEPVPAAPVMLADADWSSEFISLLPAASVAAAVSRTLSFVGEAGTAAAYSAFVRPRAPLVS